MPAVQRGRKSNVTLSQSHLRQLLGVLWIVDGLLQLQPQMFTMNMVNGVMVPMTQGQPWLIGANLSWITHVTAQHLVLANIVIAVVQVSIGSLLLTGFWVREAVVVSIVWALAVWYGGEGMSMLLTGQASILTGAPGAVLLYPLLGLVIFPRRVSAHGRPEANGPGLLSRQHLRRIFGAVWIFGALLQLQPYWWQQGQIARTASSLMGGGGLDGALLDPSLRGLAKLTSGIETPLNIALILVFLVLGSAILWLNGTRLELALIVAIIISALIWFGTEAFGMILTGTSTDFNSGLLLIVMAMTAWPPAQAFQTATRTREFRRGTSEEGAQPA